MHSDTTSIHWYARYAMLTGVATIALGVLVLLGWYLNKPTLIQVSASFAPMQYNTALGFALSGLALALLVNGARRPALLAAIPVFIIGALTLIEYIFTVDLRIDQLLMEHYIDQQTSDPGRMAPNTALCFSLTGLALVIAVTRSANLRTPAIVATIGVVVVALGIAALSGYVVGVESAYGWGHLTRMAIHTAAGFVTIGSGIVFLCWAEEIRRQPTLKVPAWMPSVVAVSGTTITIALWQALNVQEQRMIEQMGEQAASPADDGLVVFGALLTIAVFLRTRHVARADEAAPSDRSLVGPLLTVLLGALLSVSLYHLLETSFKATVKSRFEAAVAHHVESIGYGVETYVEALFHVRSGFAASSQVDRDEFGALVRRDVARLDGLRAIAWVPRVEPEQRQAMEAQATTELGHEFRFTDLPADSDGVRAPLRDRHFPVYYIEPLAPNLTYLGLDMAGLPDHRATLLRAIENDGPAVSSRLARFRGAKDAYTVFVALPVFARGMPAWTVEQRQAALEGYALAVIEIGPMIDTILTRYTRAAGVAMTFEEDQGAGREFIYHRNSRLQASQPRVSIGDEGDDWLTTSAAMSFADRQWRIVVAADNDLLYPRSNPDNLWLCLGLFVLALGLALFLHRSAQRHSERARMLAYQSALLDSIPNPIFVKGMDSVYTACNRAYEQAFGIDRRDLIGKSVLQLDYLPEDARQQAQDDDIELMEKGGLSQRETTLQFADGETHHSMYWRTTFDVEGQRSGMIGLLIDITDLKQLQEELVEARVTAEDANQAKSAFLANMSHELRTPMNAILGYSEMLTEEAEELELDDFIPDLRKINEAGNHLLALINDVLDLSKIESGRIETFGEDIEVDTMIDQIIGTAQALMRKNNNTLVDVRSTAMGTAFQDLTKLRQSLFNLISNAAKFTDQGTVTLSASREHESGQEWLTFSVSDTGIGIPADKLDAVFEEFTQADGSTTRNYGGTGLGLAISRRFCRLLGGDLTLESEVGKGSTFTIRVPARLTDAPAEEVRQSSTTTQHTNEDLEKIREESTVLVIDDDPEACEIIERFLRKDGFGVLTASSGAEGIRLAHVIKPIAITLDVMMPDMDGWAVLRTLKSDPKLSDIPVLMLTMIDDRRRGFTLGATDYLTKPVDRKQLHQALSRYRSAAGANSVLLVEDDEATRAVVAKALDKAGWQVTQAEHGRQALAALEKKKPDLILLDLMMPVMDGFEFLAELRFNQDWRYIPVIVLTAKNLSEEERRELNGKVERVYEKSSFSPENVASFVRELLGRSQGDPPPTNQDN